MNYPEFIKKLDSELEEYFNQQKEYIFCKKECSTCCEKGDFPLTELELNYLSQGFINLPTKIKKEIQNNIKIMTKGGKCPFLLNKKCSVYQYRPIICRVHGLAYISTNNIVKLPHCTNLKKNFHKVYSNNILFIEPIKKNLDTLEILKNFKPQIIKNLYDWIKK